VYYLFRGLRGVSGEPVIGRLSALNEDAVYNMLETHAIVAEAVHPEQAGMMFPPTLQNALDELGVRIRFDQMPKLHIGGGVWILDREQISGRVMRLAREVSGGAADRKPALHHIEQLLETLYGERRPSTAAAGPAEGHFANADEVRAEMMRLKAAIASLERELIAMRSRPYAGREARPSDRKKSPGDRTRDEVLREIFEHNLQLMKLTRAHGITGLTDQ
jgi:hypothetical protein